jgi:hypothetical protein
MYDETLRAHGAAFSVAAIMKDEGRHLAEMAADLERTLPGWQRRLKLVLAAEESLFSRFLGAIESTLAHGAIQSA